MDRHHSFLLALSVGVVSGLSTMIMVILAKAGVYTMLTVEEAKNYINKELADVNKNRKEDK
jgi:hypothetical protein